MDGTEKDKQRAEVYDALGHRLRLGILKSLSQRPMGFADLKRSVGIESSGQLTHHLNKLNDLIKTDEYGKYCLSDKGKDALLTMQPIEKYNEDARFREQVGLLIRALRSEVTSIQEIATVQLSLFGPKAIPYLKSALSEALLELNDPEIIKERQSYNYRFRHDNTQEATERAIDGLTKILGIISVPATVPDIVKALPRSEAFEALAKIGNNQALDAIIASMPTWFEKYVDNRQRYDTNGWELEDVDDFLRKLFGHFDEEEVKKGLENALKDEQETTKKTAARILGVVGDSSSFPALVSTLLQSNYSIKTEVSRSLVRLKASEAVPNIVAELIKIQSLSPPQTGMYSRNNEDTDLWNAKDALSDAVLELGSVDDWLQILTHRPKVNLRKRESFYDAIINSGEKAIPGLTKLLQAPDLDVQREAAEMIARIKRGDKANGRDYY
jgi:DNA-binding HxlR family transcriptional regulator